MLTLTLLLLSAWLNLSPASICGLSNAFVREVDCDFFKPPAQGGQGAQLDRSVVLSPLDYLRGAEVSPPYIHHLDLSPPPARSVRWINSWVALYPEYTHFLWSDADVDKLLGSWSTPTRCKVGIEKLDYARYVIL